jgi:MerR family transcriptional regulator, repressor of the yfmOP operon
MDGLKEGEEIISIGELAKSLGLTTRTLRYWEEVGIIESVPRSDGATRGYTPYFVRRIRFIMRLKEMGLTIREMQDLYAAYGEAKQTGRMIPRLVEILDEHISMIDEKLAGLTSLRNDIVEYRQRMMTKLNHYREGVSSGKLALQEDGRGMPASGEEKAPLPAGAGDRRAAEGPGHAVEP